MCFKVHWSKLNKTIWRDLDRQVLIISVIQLLNRIAAAANLNEKLKRKLKKWLLKMHKRSKYFCMYSYRHQGSKVIETQVLQTQTHYNKHEATRHFCKASFNAEDENIVTKMQCSTTSPSQLNWISIIIVAWSNDLANVVNISKHFCTR